MSINVEQSIKNLGLELPALPTSKGIYKRCLTIDKLVYLSGHISVNNDGTPITGKLGKDLNEDQGKHAARQCGLAMITALKDYLGDLSKN